MAWQKVFTKKGGVTKKHGLFRDADTGRFISKDDRKKLAARAYGAMSLRGKYGRAVDTLQFKTGLTEEQSQNAFKKFLSNYAGWLTGKNNSRPDVYAVARGFAQPAAERETEQIDRNLGY
jgi:hypothetical protein